MPNSVLWLFLMVPWAGLQCVIVVFPGHTYLLSDMVIILQQLMTIRLNYLCGVKRN